MKAVNFCLGFAISLLATSVMCMSPSEKKKTYSLFFLGDSNYAFEYVQACLELLRCSKVDPHANKQYEIFHLTPEKVFGDTRMYRTPPMLCDHPVVKRIGMKFHWGASLTEYDYLPGWVGHKSVHDTPNEPQNVAAAIREFERRTGCFRENGGCYDAEGDTEAEHEIIYVLLSNYWDALWYFERFKQNLEISKKNKAKNPPQIAYKAATAANTNKEKPSPVASPPPAAPPIVKPPAPAIKPPVPPPDNADHVSAKNIKQKRHSLNHHGGRKLITPGSLTQEPLKYPSLPTVTDWAEQFHRNHSLIAQLILQQFDHSIRPFLEEEVENTSTTTKTESSTQKQQRSLRGGGAGKKNNELDEQAPTHETDIATTLTTSSASSRVKERLILQTVHPNVVDWSPLTAILNTETVLIGRELNLPVFREDLLCLEYAYNVNDDRGFSLRNYLRDETHAHQDMSRIVLQSFMRQFMEEDTTKGIH